MNDKPKVVDLKNRVDSKVVARLEELLERARSGEIVAVSYVLDYGSETQAGSVGKIRKADALLAFEYWKNDMLFSDNNPQ